MLLTDRSCPDRKTCLDKAFHGNRKVTSNRKVVGPVLRHGIFGCGWTRISLLSGLTLCHRLMGFSGILLRFSDLESPSVTDVPQPPVKGGGSDFPADVRPRSYLQRAPLGNTSGLDPRDVASVLWRRRWIVAAGFFGVMAAVVTVTLLLPKRYESSASFLVEPRGNPGSGAALDVLQRMDRVQNTETEVSLLTGRRVVEPVVERLKLNASFETSGRWVAPDSVLDGFEDSRNAVSGVYLLKWSNGEYRVLSDASKQVLARAEPGERLGFANVSFRAPSKGSATTGRLRILPFAQAVDETRSHLEAKPVEQQADLINLTCTGPTPASSLALCGSVSDSYLELRSELQRAEASAAASFLQDQVVQVHSQLSTAEDSLQAYEERGRAVALKERADEEVRQYADLRAQREQLSAEHQALASLIEQIRSGDADPSAYRKLASFPTFLKNQNNVVATLVESLVELENRRSDLAVKRKDANPELAALNARIVQIDDQLLSVAMSYDRSLQAQIQSLGQALEDHGQELSTIPVKEIQVSRLRRQVDVLEKLYRFLQTRLQEAQVAKAVKLPNVRMVDRASLPYKPSFPNTPLNLVLGAVLGLGMGLLGALWREYADDKLRDRDEVEGAGIPVLTMVPRVRGPVAEVITVEEGKTAIAPPRENGKSRTDRVAEEAFRSLAFELEAAARRIENGDLRSVAITSSGRAEGKTFCACNLAVQAAWLGKRTLLVDSDAHAQGVSRWLKLARGRIGLGEVLREGADPDVAIQTISVGGGQTLDVLQSGKPHCRSAWLLSPSLKSLIMTMSTRYDLVVIDTPPLNVLSDAAQVASAVDGVIVVVRGGVTERDGFDLTMQRLERAGGRLVGVVLNDIDLPDYYTSYSGVTE